MAASIGTFVTYLAHKLQHKEWNYDINLITWSAGVFYGYVLVVPLCLYIILKYFSAPSGLVQLFCLYGYSLFVFIPAMVRILFLKFVNIFMSSDHLYYTRQVQMRMTKTRIKYLMDVKLRRIKCSFFWYNLFGSKFG